MDNNYSVTKPSKELDKKTEKKKGYIFLRLPSLLGYMGDNNIEGKII